MADEDYSYYTPQPRPVNQDTQDMSQYSMAQTRRLLKQVAKTLHQRKDRVTGQELLAMAQDVKPSTICTPTFE